MEILSLCWAFFKIGIVSFGGGWAIVGLIKAEVVPRWLDDGGFRSLVAIAQSTPGPLSLNAATLVGWNQAGIAGAFLSTLSVIAFPVAAIALAGIAARRLKPDQAALDESLKTGTLAMMGMTLWALRPASLDPFAMAAALASFALMTFTKISPLWAIFGAGIAKAVLGAILRRA
jgi:chromate transporter